MDTLTKQQRALKREIEEIVRLAGIEFDDIGFVDKKWRTPYLQRVKDRLIRSAVVLDYALIDEYLDALIGAYIFGRKKGAVDPGSTKRFRNFKHFVLERLSLSEKLDFAKAIQRGVPRAIDSAIRKIDELSSALAHPVFPENRKLRPPRYGGRSIYTVDGFKLYWEDARRIDRYFHRRLWR